MEILAEPQRRDGIAGKLVEELVAHCVGALASNDASARTELSAVQSAVLALRRESINKALRRLAEACRPDDAGEAAAMVARATGKRSAFLHGSAVVVDAADLDDTRELVRDMIRFATGTSL